MDLLSESRNRINIPPEQFLNNLKAGEHGCVFFLSKEDLQMIYYAFVKSGLENNWGVVYTIATESIDEVRNAMQKYGINTQYYEKEGGGERGEREGNGSSSLIIIRGEDLYTNPDSPDIENWIKTIKSISDMFVSKGKKGGQSGIRLIFLFSFTWSCRTMAQIGVCTSEKSIIANIYPLCL
jgi:hypothetical protein